MPEEASWASFFDPEAATKKLLKETMSAGAIVEFGAGYGTFTVPAARQTRSTITALDIDPLMIGFITQKAKDLGLPSIHAVLRDFVADGTGLEADTQAHAMIYNLLHLEDPVALLREAYRVLRTGGYLSVMHWRSDVETPRGPPLEIRPTPDQCRAWIESAGFAAIETVDLETCCPYHFGLIAKK